MIPIPPAQPLSTKIAHLLPAIRAVYAREATVAAAREATAVATVRRLLDAPRRAVEALAPAVQRAFEQEAAFRQRAGDAHAAQLRSELRSLLDRRCHALRARVDGLLEIEPRFPQRDDPASLHLGFFDACRLSRNEVAQTLMLAYLLDPTSAHGLGARPLHAFLRLLVENSAPASPTWLSDPIDVAKIKPRAAAELPVATPDGEGDRRLDVVVWLGDRRIIVEAKVDARESEDQLRDIESHAPAAALVFLTRDRAEPRTAGHPERWTRIAWQDVAAAMAVAVHGADAPGAELVRLWCSGMLHEIARLNTLDQILRGQDVQQFTKLFDYLTTWRAIADAMEPQSGRTLPVALPRQVEGDAGSG